MVDVWLNSRFTKMSPEDETVKVYHLNDATSTGGGAANVARQLKALSNYEELEWEVDLFGIVGKDAMGFNLCKMLLDEGINWRGIGVEDHCTTAKVRLYEGEKQILRMDEESTTFSEEVKESLTIKLNSLFRETKYDVIVISDYAKGLISKELMEIVKKQGTPIFVDPKLVNIDLYKGVYLLKLNKKDLEDLWDARELFFPEIEDATIGMWAKYMPHRIVVTLAGGGSVTYGPDWHYDNLRFETFRSEFIQRPYVCGAGDVYLSVLVYCYLQNLDEEYSCNIATQTATEFCKSISTVIPNVRRDYIPE